MGLTISVAADKLTYDYVILERKNGEVHALSYKEQLQDIESLKLDSDNKLPIVVSVQAKGVLSKTISLLEEDSDTTIISKVLPNAEAQDFYISKTQLGESSSMVSVIRRETCNAILETLPQSKVLSLSIGPNQIPKLAKVIGGDSVWYFGNQSWEYKDHQLRSAKIDNKSENKVDYPEWQKIEGESIPTNCLEAYAHGLSFLIEDTEASVPLEQHEVNQQDLFFSKLFTISGWSALITLFSVLLINFLLFDHFDKKKNSLNVQLSHNSLALDQMEALEKQISFKENFIKYNSTDQTRFSYYSDRLASLLPRNIVLVDLYIQPLQKRIKQGKETQLEKAKILIRGFTKNSTTLNRWVKDIQKEDWVKDTEVMEYNREAANLSGEFELAIELNKKE